MYNSIIIIIGTRFFDYNNMAKLIYLKKKSIKLNCSQLRLVKYRYQEDDSKAMFAFVNLVGKI